MMQTYTTEGCGLLSRLVSEALFDFVGCYSYMCRRMFLLIILTFILRKLPEYVDVSQPKVYQISVVLKQHSVVKYSETFGESISYFMNHM